MDEILMKHSPSFLIFMGAGPINLSGSQNQSICVCLQAAKVFMTENMSDEHDDNGYDDNNPLPDAWYQDKMTPEQWERLCSLLSQRAAMGVGDASPERAGMDQQISLMKSQVHLEQYIKARVAMTQNVQHYNDWGECLLGPHGLLAETDINLEARMQQRQTQYDAFVTSNRGRNSSPIVHREPDRKDLNHYVLRRSTQFDTIVFGAGEPERCYTRDMGVCGSPFVPERVLGPPEDAWARYMRQLNQ